MKQTPVHDRHNPDLLALIPPTAKNLIEVGCSSGALARALKAQRPECYYVGVEIDSEYSALASASCDECLTADIEAVSREFWDAQRGRDCWVFGDTLEHLKDPWRILSEIRAVIPSDGAVVACVPNAQHWSLIARLSVGDFRYQDSGLLDRTHLRWFTRQTLIELFRDTGFHVEYGKPRIFNEANREKFLPAIELMAKSAGVDSRQALIDATALQYVVRARPS